PTPVGPIIRMFFGSTSSRSLSSSLSRRQRLRSAIATARLASLWPTMKRSSSETISRGEKSVMGELFGPCRGPTQWCPSAHPCASLPGRAPSRLLDGRNCLPGFDRVDRVQDHDHVERKVVVDQGGERQLSSYRQRHNAPRRQQPGEGEAEHHHDGVADRV